MKNNLLVFTILLLSLAACLKGTAQAQELQQLALNVEKLAQFKQLLSDLKKGYEILNGGYNTIKNISQGNFTLHKVFLDGLLEVNPAVKKYYKVSAIVQYQVQIMEEYKKSLAAFKKSVWVNPEEIKFISGVYDNLTKQSVKNLEDLLTIITSSELRMSDEERLSAIDNIYQDMHDKLRFLRSFNGNASILSLQRAREANETLHLQRLSNVK